MWRLMKLSTLFHQLHNRKPWEPNQVHQRSCKRMEAHLLHVDNKEDCHHWLDLNEIDNKNLNNKGNTTDEVGRSLKDETYVYKVLYI